VQAGAGIHGPFLADHTPKRHVHVR